MISLASGHRVLRNFTVLPSEEWDTLRPYGVRFWLAYLANFLICIAMNTLVRYADFVREIGGTAWELGWIVGIGTIGSLAVRFYLGRAADRHGAQKVWIASLMLFSVACFAHLWVSNPHGAGIYFWRLVFSTAIAGIFGASTTFISQGAGPERMAELIGMLGTSGFLGVIVGTQLGDFITVGLKNVRLIFVVGGTLALAAAFFAWAASAGMRHRSAPGNVSSWRAVRQFSHYSLIILGIAMGMALGLPPVFLPAIAHSWGVERVGLFFAVYAPVAIVTRIATRGIFSRWDLRLLAGGSMMLLALGHCLILLGRSEWALAIPAVIFGVGHAIVYPTVVSLGATRFPEEYRGLGTSLMLAASDLGMIIGAPLASGLLVIAGRLGLAQYPTMVITVSVLLSVMTIFFVVTVPRPAARGSLPRSQRQDLPAFPRDDHERVATSTYPGNLSDLDGALEPIGTNRATTPNPKPAKVLARN